MKKTNKLSGSFRDPSGFIFQEDHIIYRQINLAYKENYDKLLSSGLYKKLVKRNLLIPHKESEKKPPELEISYKVIKPSIIPFISYPYEWSFSQLKAAALVTLNICLMALEHNMILKDASAFNIQFLDNKPILIDTLSFTTYKKNTPWVAYKQFCQHFLAPLALMSYTDIRTLQLMRTNIDGIPMDLASKLLPKKSWLNLGIATHVHLHAKTQIRYANKHQALKTRPGTISKFQLINIITNLHSTIKSLNWKIAKTEWGDYYNETNYTDKAFTHKQKLVKAIAKKIKPKQTWDLGANTGVFSITVAPYTKNVIAFDIDPLAVERNYLKLNNIKINNILPLVQDLANPSPALGWHNQERMSLIERGPVDLVLALALIHHLAISNNLPLGSIAEYLHNITADLVIEFVPKTDSQVQKMLSSREDIFEKYTQKKFEDTFGKYFHTKQKNSITDSKRILYWFKAK